MGTVEQEIDLTPPQTAVTDPEKDRYDIENLARIKTALAELRDAIANLPPLTAANTSYDPTGREHIIETDTNVQLAVNRLDDAIIVNKDGDLRIGFSTRDNLITFTNTAGDAQGLIADAGTTFRGVVLSGTNNGFEMNEPMMIGGDPIRLGFPGAAANKYLQLDTAFSYMGIDVFPLKAVDITFPPPQNAVDVPFDPTRLPTVIIVGTEVQTALEQLDTGLNAALQKPTGWFTESSQTFNSGSTLDFTLVNNANIDQRFVLNNVLSTVRGTPLHIKLRGDGGTFGDAVNSYSLIKQFDGVVTGFHGIAITSIALDWSDLAFSGTTAGRGVSGTIEFQVPRKASIVAEGQMDLKGYQHNPARTQSYHGSINLDGVEKIEAIRFEWVGTGVASSGTITHQTMPSA